MGHVRRTFAVHKVGHLGTLDPLATGVLPLVIGKATRLSRFITGDPKQYTGRIRLGFSTTTYDLEGAPTSEPTPFTGTVEDVARSMKALTGQFLQTPPPYSAKKVGGVAAYRLARKGVDVQLQPAEVTVTEFVLTAFNPAEVEFRVTCSPGTYIRSLGHELGLRLGCGAHLTALRRTRSGRFSLEDATPMDAVNLGRIIPLEDAVDPAPEVRVTDEEAAQVRQGSAIRRDLGRASSVLLKDSEGRLIAVAEAENGLVLPKVVLT